MAGDDALSVDFFTKVRTPQGAVIVEPLASLRQAERPRTNAYVSGEVG